MLETVAPILVVKRRRCRRSLPKMFVNVTEERAEGQIVTYILTGTPHCGADGLKLLSTLVWSGSPSSARNIETTGVMRPLINCPGRKIETINLQCYLSSLDSVLIPAINIVSCVISSSLGHCPRSLESSETPASLQTCPDPPGASR